MIAATTAMLMTLGVGVLTATESYEGQVLSQNQRQIVVMVGREPMAFAIDDATQVVIDGQPSELRQLRRGHAVTILASSSGPLLKAELIEARSSPSQPTAHRR